MNPPMFSSPTRGLSEPIQYLHRARMFRDAAIACVDYTNGEMNWPKYALLLQSIELALKAYCRQRFAEGQPREDKGNHDLKAWYDVACRCGLPHMPDVASNLYVLTPLHLDHTARYPNNRSVPELAHIAANTAEAVITAVSKTILKG